MSRDDYIEQKRNELVGNIYGNIEVLKFNSSHNGRIYYECKCRLCGNTFVTRKDGITNGHVTSCGCVRQKRMHSGNLNRRHGLYKDRAYWLWTKVKSRCYNPNSREYKNYGGRGIIMCDEWLNPQNFVEWCYANGYDKDAPKGQCTLDRIDVNKGYQPDNCRFITNQEQQNNRRDCIKVEYHGEVHTMAEWARIFDIPYTTMTQIIKSGKSLDYLKDGYTPRKKR